MSKGFYAIVDSRVCGIPCKLGVKEFNRVAPWRGGAQTAPSDLDFHGYTDCEFIVLDRRERPAPWLEKKMQPKDWDICTADVENAL